MPKWLGPGDVLQYKDKYYRAGDNIPMSKEEVEHHVVWGKLRFEGFDSESGLVIPTPVVLTMPHDDRGQEILLNDKNVPEKDQPAPVVVATPPSVATADATPTVKN